MTTHTRKGVVVVLVGRRFRTRKDLKEEEQKVGRIVAGWLLLPTRMEVVILHCVMMRGYSLLQCGSVLL